MWVHESPVSQNPAGRDGRRERKKGVGHAEAKIAANILGESV